MFIFQVPYPRKRVLEIVISSQASAQQDAFGDNMN